MNNNDESKKKTGEVEMSNIHADDEMAHLSKKNVESKQNADDEIRLKVKNDELIKGQYIRVSPNETERNQTDKNERMVEEDPLLGKMILDVDKGLLVDEKEFDGMGNDNIRDPEIFDRVEEEVNMMHPGRKKEDGLTEKYPVCKTDTGIMGCCQSNNKSELIPMGLGIVVYFKILKAFSIVFFVIIILNIPLYLVYTTSHPEFKVTGYKDVFFKTTIGNIALKQCIKIPYQTFLTSSTYNFKFDCQSYNISSIVKFGGVSDSQTQLENLQQCQNFTTSVNVTTDTGCSLESDLLTSLKDNNCLKTSACNINVTLSQFRGKCKYTNGSDTDSILKPSYIYLVYECYDEWISATSYKIARTNFAYVVVALDIASMASLLIALAIIAISQRITDNYFKVNVVEISDYTIHFKKLSLKNDNLNEELNSLLEHIYKVNKIENPSDNYEDIIYDMNYPVLTYRKLDLILEKNRVTEQINNKKTDLEIFEKTYPVHKVENIRKEINFLREREQKLRNDILQSNEKEMETVDDIYMTFTHQKYRNKLLSQYQRGACRRCCLICCCQSHKIKHLYFRDRWLVVQDSTDQPSNIRWQNVPYSTARRCIRKFIAIAIALIVILASFGIVIGTKYAQIEINKKINTDIDCSFFTSFDNSTIIAETKVAQERLRVNTHCYCRSMLISQGIPYTKNITMTYVNDTNQSTTLKPCETWVDMFLYSQGLMVATFILVPLVNVILSVLLTMLTELERNKSVSLSSSSNMWKSFLLQVVNTAIVILLVNINITEVKKWRSDFPLFTGIYSDFDPRWYQNVGVTIIFCMILNIITPHSYALLSYFLTSCKRYCDKKCCTSGRKTKKNTRSEFIALYLGPQFNIGLRYSQLLTTIFVVLMYSSGMPILYVCCFCFIFVCYWVDKFLLLRFYRNPPHIDLYMSNLFNLILLFGVILHYCFGIWIYGNDQILTNSANTYLQTISDWVKNLLKFQDQSFAANVLNRITYSHNIIVLIVLCLLVLYFIVRVFLWDIIKRLICCCCCCCSCEEEVEVSQDVNIYDAVRIKGLYLNHQLRKATYFKLQDGKRYEYLIDKYLRRMIDVDRTNIKRRLSGLTKIPLSDSNKNFDVEIPKFIKNLKQEEKPIIENDISYNIAYFPEFKDVVYYDFILPYLKKEKEN